MRVKKEREGTNDVGSAWVFCHETRSLDLPSREKPKSRKAEEWPKTPENPPLLNPKV